MIWAIVILAVMAVVTRLLPFFFAKQLKANRFARRLANWLPPIILLLLVAHTLMGTPVRVYPYGLPQAIGIAVAVGLHLWRRNMLLSIFGSSGAYMILLKCMG
jgi:branched-subunit amino acid transport protein AzlD